jgi:hypothetical protein
MVRCKECHQMLIKLLTWQHCGSLLSDWNEEMKSAKSQHSRWSGIEFIDCYRVNWGRYGLLWIQMWHVFIYCYRQLWQYGHYGSATELLWCAMTKNRFCWCPFVSHAFPAAFLCSPMTILVYTQDVLFLSLLIIISSLWPHITLNHSLTKSLPQQT